jgi:hypothetical protein
MNSKLLFLTISLVNFVFSGYSQKLQAPNYDEIEKNCSHPNSFYHFDKIFKKYQDGDSAMSIEEKRHLYYGFQFTDKYSPYGSGKFSDSLRKVFDQEGFTDAHAILAIRYCDSILDNDPFDLKTLNTAINLYNKQGNLERKALTQTKLNILLDAILSSGDGLTDNTAIYIIAVPHEYFIIKVLGFKAGGMQRLIGKNDYLKLEENNDKIAGLYFDVTASFGSMSRMFGDKKKKKK